jgi:hypothetical protein
MNTWSYAGPSNRRGADMRHYFLTAAGCTIHCDEVTLLGWVDFALEKGHFPLIELIQETTNEPKGAN